MSKTEITAAVNGQVKILVIKSSIKLSASDLKAVLGVKKVKKRKGSDDFIYWLETAIRHKSIVDDVKGEDFKFYEVGSDATSGKLNKKHPDFGFALTFDNDAIDDFIDAAVIFDEIMQIRVDQHNCLTKHTELMNTLTGWRRDPKSLNKFGATMEKISNEYGQKLMEHSYDVLNDALVSSW